VTETRRPSSRKGRRAWIAGSCIAAALVASSSALALTGAFGSGSGPPSNPIVGGAGGEGVRFGSGDGYYLTPTQLYVTNDGGKSLVPVSPPVSVSSLVSSIGGVGLAGDAVLLAVTSSGPSTTTSPDAAPTLGITIYRSTDDGATWNSSQLSNVDQLPARYQFVTDGSHVVGLLVQATTSAQFSAGNWYSTSDDGATWTHDAIPSGGTVTDLSGTLWLVGGPLDDQLYISTDNGTSWTASSVPSPSASDQPTPYALSPPLLASDGNVIVVATEPYSEPTQVKVYSSADNGNTWSAVGSTNLPAEFGAGSGAAIGIAGNVLWLPVQKADGTNVLTTFDVTSGSSQQIPMTGFNGYITDLQITKDQDALATIAFQGCASGKTGCTFASGLVVTSDGGHTWSAVVPTPKSQTHRAVH